MLTLLVVHAVLASNTSAPVLLRYKFRRGETHAYQMNMKLDMQSGSGAASQPFDSTVSGSIREAISSVAANGTATLSVVMHTSGTGVAANMMGTSSDKPVILRMSPTGQVSGDQMTKLGGGGMMGSNFGSIFGASLPEKPVSVGSHWTSQMNMGNVPMTFHDALVAIKSENGHQLAVIGTTSDVDLSKFGGMMGGGTGSSIHGTMHITSTAVFDNTTGILRSTEQNSRTIVEMGAGGKGGFSLHGTERMKMTLVH